MLCHHTAALTIAERAAFHAIYTIDEFVERVAMTAWSQGWGKEVGTLSTGLVCLVRLEANWESDRLHSWKVDVIRKVFCRSEVVIRSMQSDYITKP